MPDLLTDLIHTGRAVDIVLAVLALELLVIWLWRRRGGPIRPADILANALSGACLLLALRTALTGGLAGLVAIWLLLAFTAHLADLVRLAWRGAAADR